MPDEPHNAEEKRSAQPPSSALFDLGFLTAITPPPESPGPALEKPGDFIGRYCLISPLGEGGFGYVWRARQTEPIQRELALKLIKPGMDSREIIARFEAERQALALMDHPNIAAVLDAGTTATLRPYFVMELVKGEPITDYCDRLGLGIRERLELFIPVCQAVQHAHQKAIIHRDLKPSNILVATVDGRPVPKVIDFGIAKALDTGDPSPLLRTQLGSVIGTPRYMSPEQAGSMPDVDTRSDVYSLGVILCELLTGQGPLPDQPTDMVDVLRWIRETEPVKPSTLVLKNNKAATQRGGDMARQLKALKGDLDWITLKALEKDRSRRYETATALARDLERHLAQEPVSAVAPTWSYKLGKFARRQRAALVAASLIAAALVAGLVASLWQAARAERHRVEAEGHYAQARDAVEQYLTRVTNHPRLKEANFMDLQRELLETAVPFYQKMTQYQGDDTKLRSDRVWAMVRLARLYKDLADYDKAEAAYLEALKEQEKLMAAFPDEPLHQMELAYQHNELAYARRLRGHAKEARSSYDTAVRFQEDLWKRFPEQAQYQHAFSAVLGNRAVALTEMREFKAAENDFARAGRILMELVRRFPRTTGYWLTLGNVLNSLGYLHHQNNRLELAYSGYSQAMEHLEQAVVGDPHNREYRHALGSSITNVGSILLIQKKNAEAEEALRRAVDLHQRLVDEFPTVPSYRQECIRASDLLARHLLSTERVAEADALLERIQAHRQRLAADFPTKRQYAEELAVTLLLQAGRAYDRKDWPVARDRYLRVLQTRPTASEPHLRLCRIALKTKDHANALKHGVEYSRLDDAPGWQNQEMAACLLLEAVPLIHADAKLEAAQRDALVDECAGHILSALKKALARGYVGLGYFNRLRSVDMLRTRPEFQALLNTPCEPHAQVPAQFSFDYKFDNPGPRLWSREGLTWTEKQPGDGANTFALVGPTKLNGITGTELRKLGPKQLTVFMPDLGTPAPMKLMMRNDDGTWSSISTMKDVK